MCSFEIEAESTEAIQLRAFQKETRIKKTKKDLMKKLDFAKLMLVICTTPDSGMISGILLFQQLNTTLKLLFYITTKRLILQ